MRSYLIKNYGYDAGHSLVGALIALIYISLGFSPLLAAILGGTLYAIPKELWDRHHAGGYTWDNLSDLVSYQTAWPAAFFAAGHTFWGFVMLALLYVAYDVALGLKGVEWET